MRRLLRVFVVDDDPTARTLVDVWLTHAKHTVFPYASGGEVVQVLASSGLIKPDIMHPTVSGVDVARAAKNRGIPVMIYTGQDLGLIPPRWQPWSLLKSGNRAMFMEKLNDFAHPSG